MLEILPLATNVIGDQGLAILEIILMRYVREIQVLFNLCITVGYPNWYPFIAFVWAAFFALTYLEK